MNNWCIYIEFSFYSYRIPWIFAICLQELHNATFNTMAVYTACKRSNKNKFSLERQKQREKSGKNLGQFI